MRKQTKSTYPKAIQSMIRTALKKGLNASKTAERLNSSKLAEKLGVYYTTRGIAATFGHINNGRCAWYQNS